MSITELLLSIRGDPWFQNPKWDIVEAQHKMKPTEASEQTRMRSLVLSLVVLVVPLHVPLGLYNRGWLIFS